MLKITILGCGSSLGVPVLKCKCAVCSSNNPKNKRTRSSILINNQDPNQENNILIDCGFDIKTQLIRADVEKLDAVFLTHHHADHISGLDELRAFSSLEQPARIPFYMTEQSREQVMGMFEYLFKKQHLCAKIIDYYDQVDIQNLKINLFKQDHTVMDTLGFRINNFVYANDVAFFYDQSLQYLQAIDVFLVDCCAYQSSKVHAGLERVLLWHEQFAPKITYLTNLSHHIDYFEIKKILPANVYPVYDNMIIYI